jgi:crotonobetainyl-CoA:carnitine CoA-transferase CaiB-like acyl-CoA transferase
LDADRGDRAPAAEPALRGVRVLALEQAAAAPFASHVRADLGAEVSKIERPGTGDVIRGWDHAVHGLSTGYVWLNRAKRSVVVDAKTDAGRAILRRLALEVDVLLTNLGPGAIERLGLGYDDLVEENPGLIHCNVSGYGLTGPYRDVKAYDLLVQGEAGVILINGYPDAPAKVGIPITDIAAGSYAAMAILGALYQRERTGRGQVVDISMFESTLDWLGYFPQHYWHQGEEPERVGMRHHYIVPYGPYLAADGEYVSLVVASASDWERICRDVFERPDLLDDARFADAPKRRTNRRELDALVEEIVASRPSEAWFARLQAAELPYGQVRGMASVLAHPQVAARGTIREVDSPVGRIPTIETPFRMSESPVAEGPIPDLGGDSEAVLLEAGYSPEEVSSFRRAGVIGAPARGAAD